MKTTKFHILVLTNLLLGGILNAQVAIDPVKNVYKIGGSSELFISYTDGTYANHGVLDVSTALDSITSVEEPLQTMHLDHRKTASATGDFNGDGADNVVSVTANEEGRIRIIIPLIGDDLKISGIKEYDLEEQAHTRIRVIAGNFDHDQQDEFAICYDLPDGTMTIILFKTDSVLNIEQIASLNIDPEGLAAGYENEIKHFDISAGDVDGNGISEIVMVKNKAMPYRKANSDPPIFISTYDLYILKYDPISEKLAIHEESEFKIENNISSGNYYPDRGSIINEMRITCGDLSNDGREEIVVGWSYYYSHYRYNYCTNRNIFGSCTNWVMRYQFQNTVWLNTFKLTAEGIENHQNLLVDIDHNFGQRGVSEDQHIAMTLECEQIDNLGGAEVLVNSSWAIHVFGIRDEYIGLTKMTQIMSQWLHGEYFLNLQGNEVFAIADLNPDTTALNFNKEIIFLQSDKKIFEQLDTSSIVTTTIAISSPQMINADTIIFNHPGPALDIPFSSGENIETSTFLAGDFDLNDAEVYFVGTPVITPVSDLQQPIVILNSPPVHFDMIGGEVFDLCNAYNTTGEPAFFARYNSTVGENKTTSVDVNNGYGFSSDFRAYAMAGGTGLEAAVNANWEKGRSFYNASSQNKTIEQEKSISTEDFVLRSSMDYSFYKYPVYDRNGEKLGEIAVLNPVSNEFSSAWKSAYDWIHPSYVFNHEPGNILSYKQRKKSADFSTSPGFKSYEYASVPVHSTGDGRFLFTFGNISAGEESYSYSGGIGASLFMKAGLETTATLSFAPGGLGGSVASDVRIGVSAELSAYYHNSSLSTHSTELRNTFKVEGYIGRLAQAYDPTARYDITPYIYRSQSGALVLDYIVDIPQNSSWWNHYRTNPDLAFILPWRYATEKGSLHMPVSLKQKTSDIQFYPPIASPGDTVVIIARVHNFSLAPFDSLLKIDFYLGDPVDGGVKLTNIYNVAGSSTYSTMIYGGDQDREEYLTFIWQVPDTLSCSPRIYGVIDPENVYTEIHKNNNVGWNMLNIYDCQDCKYVERITGTENILVKQMNFKAYPNPFSSHSQIRFLLPQPEAVQIDLYNLAGHKVTTIASKMYGSGEHEVRLDAENLDNGIYICRITSGSYTENIKLILMR